MYKGGASVIELIQRFHLSEDSIRKIIVKTRELVQNVAK
jgi:Mor family transcriptional regulator